MELDETLTLAGPEGIDLDLRLAGIGSRGAALLIDAVGQFALLWLLLVASAAFEEGGVALFAIASFLVVLGYPTLAEAFAGGQTLGKRALGIAVVRTDGGPAGFVAAAIRNVVRIVDLLPGTYTVGLVAVLASSRNQRLGDAVAGTLVVRRGRPQHVVGGTGIPGVVGAAGAIELPPEVAGWDTSAVTADEAAAIRAFLERRLQLDPRHRAELADTLARQVLPKVAGVPLDGGPEAFLERVAYVRTLRGR